MSRHDRGWLLICLGGILLVVQLLPMVDQAGAALLALLAGGLLWRIFGEYRDRH